MTMARLKFILCCIFNFIILTHGQYEDDTDYDHEFYQDSSVDYSQSWELPPPQNALQDDFYSLNVIDDTELEKDIYQDINEFSIGFTSNENSFKAANSFNNQLEWYKMPEKVYRYTKHRIPGYDYDELDYFDIRNSKMCDEKSIWTHCLCQFTCREPDIIDCYTPCKSGCECKENYVFDEKQQQCLLPEECSSIDKDIYNN